MLKEEAVNVLRNAAWLGSNEDREKVEEAIETLASAQPLTAYVISDEDGNIKCSNCGSFECWGDYCMDCGAKMDGVKDDG